MQAMGHLQTKDVARAQAGVITDRVLAHMIDSADAATAGHLSHADAELMLLCFKPLLLELQDYRARAAASCEIMADALPANVVLLREVRE
jgi:hypothetical protein